MPTPFPSPTKTWHSTSYSSISPTRPELSAKGKSILITGGGTGIGAETALSFAAAGAARIALLGRREQPLLDTKASIQSQFANVEVFTASADVTEKDAVDAAFAAFVERADGNGAGKIDVLVSAAAVIGPQDPVETVDTERFLSSIDTNLRGALNTAQAFLRYASASAVIIDVNSNAAVINYGPGFSAYSVSKLSVFRLWDSVAAAKPSLSVFHLQPGVVDTDMNKEAGGVKAIGYEDHVSLPGHFNVWLASGEASFLRGKFLYSNWDVEELLERRGEIEGGGLLSVGLGGWPFEAGEWSPTWDK
ncbi:hypothetical protein BDW59DRAFT_181057 [Aspergillus cavernicola]|uniref:Ketoreductase domain-containing protein n=1 Tax=Aspergillus cavernicola TaxID=176166 RepID=A0ABR4I3C6_9EURO